jgi:hypothetical protein
MFAALVNATWPSAQLGEVMEKISKAEPKGVLDITI